LREYRKKIWKGFWRHNMNLSDIQQELRKQKLDGWLFFDHHLRDPLAYRILGLTPGKGPSRRWYYMIPAEGEPKGMEHRIERNQLAGLPAKRSPTPVGPSKSPPSASSRRG
jgi:hypothetical protein